MATDRVRDLFATLADDLERRQREAALSPPVSYPGLTRYFLWRGGVALAGPLLILVTSPFTSGVGATVVMGSGLVALILAGFAGGATALGRPTHATGFATLGGAVLLAAVTWSRSTPVRVAPEFVVGIALLFGFVGVLIGAVVQDVVARELDRE